MHAAPARVPACCCMAVHASALQLKRLHPLLCYAGADRPFVRPVPEPSFRSKWELPKAGSMAPPPLVSNVRTYSMFAAMDAAFAEAVDAANAVSVPPGSTEREVAVARRAAAEAGLRRALGAMGLDAGDVSLPPPDEEAVLAAAPPDLRAAVGGIWGR